MESKAEELAQLQAGLVSKTAAMVQLRDETFSLRYVSIFLKFVFV